jgi:nitrogen-specific signal transduction histidine kinase/ActR/RegA family two-component response regulator
VESRWALTRDALGQPKSILILSTDVTERKRNEAHHLRAQRMESIGTLAGGIAHDLNNLLAPMMMSVDLLRETCTDQDSLDLLRTLQVSASRGADLVQQVLSFARGVEGERVPVSPVLLVRELQKIIRDSFPKSVRVVVSHDDGLWSVLGDPTQLHQVLLNLCINARDAMPDGGELSIAVENAEVDDVYAAHNPDARVGDYVVIRLSDTGVGISPAVRDRIFEPFFSTKDVGRGTGLGLSTSMAIVRSHGGFISLYSEPGSGTTFRVFLPANRAELAPSEAPRSVPVMVRGNGELVLVVDDEAPIRRIAQRTLERFGYRVLVAANGVEAAAIYAERGADIDLVLTDMAMPVMDGPALITALREIDPLVRIIGSSGLASVDGVDEGLAGPLSRFVPKPYTAETMLRAVHDALLSPAHGA